MPQHKTWSGGTTPSFEFTEVSAECQAYMIDLYKSELAAWEAFWGDYPDADTRAVFRNRAKLDAWATFYQQ